jgi:hypothetical protein
MTQQTYAILSIIVFLGFFLAFVLVYFSSLKSEIRQFWNILNDKLRIRLDKIPNLAETIKNSLNNQNENTNKIVEIREKSWPMETASKQKVNIELEISSVLHNLWSLEKTNKSLAQNINFLELKMEFKDISKEIDMEAEKYNAKVRMFNRLYENIVLKPLLRLMGFGRLPIFEFEA